MFFSQWFEVDGVKCQGKTEARMARILFDVGYAPTRGSPQKTPLGNYNPDFDCGHFFVEVKSINSWLQAHGLVPLMEKARDPKLSQKSDKQHLKMVYVNEHTKPIIVLVDMTFNKKVYREMGLPNTPLHVIIGKPEHIMEEFRSMNLPRRTHAN
jgi:hypothetical protein